MLQLYPSEAVGLIGRGVGGMADYYERLLNVAQGLEFEIERDSLRAALRSLEEAGAEPMVLCHSHPGGVAELSERDIDGLREWPGLIGIAAVRADAVVDFKVFAIESAGSVRNVLVTIER